MPRCFTPLPGAATAAGRRRRGALDAAGQRLPGDTRRGGNGAAGAHSSRAMADDTVDVSDERLLELLNEEEALKQLKEEVRPRMRARRGRWRLASARRRSPRAQVDEAIAKRLGGLESGAQSAEAVRRDLEEDMFWSEEIERRLRESSDARLALQLIKQQKDMQEMGRAAGSAGSSAAEGKQPGVASDHAEELELARVEAEFEAAMRSRTEETDQALAERLAKREGVARAPPELPTSPKLRLAQRLIRRFQRRAETAGVNGSAPGSEAVARPLFGK